MFSRLGFLPARLLEEVYSRAALPLQALNVDPMCQHPGPSDAPVCGPYQSDGDHNHDLSASPQVGFQLLCYESASYTFQGIRGLHIYYPITGGDEGGKLRHF